MPIGRTRKWREGFAARLFFCRSTNIVPVSTKTKSSVGRAVVGGTVGGLFNPLGTIIGAASGINGKRGKTKFLCQDCGKVFERKI